MSPGTTLFGKENDVITARVEPVQQAEKNLEDWAYRERIFFSSPEPHTIQEVGDIRQSGPAYRWTSPRKVLHL